MKCIICDRNMTPYFIKKDKNCERHFVKCENCGLVIDETYYELSPLMREKENVEFHASYQGTNENIVDPNWIDRLKTQSKLFAQLFYEGIFPLDLNIVDYGCGDGKLSDYFIENYKHLIHVDMNKTFPKIKKYDKYMNISKKTEYLTIEDLKPKTFDAVITCSVFEHLIGKKDVDEILGLLNKNGIFCLHTLVCEEIPKDPDWYYLLPVHCTIWTNRAMELLYEENNFKGCAYNVEARMWFMFKRQDMFLKLKYNSDKVDGTWIFSEHFVDYWKKKPYKNK